MLGFFLFLVGMGTLWLCHHLVESETRDRVFTQVESLPEQRIALVLGCSEHLMNGRKNLFFQFRIDAAERLWDSGKVEYFILSGDNSKKSYDEPTAMKKALVKRGIPESKIFLDHAGFRTLDSVIRAAEVFQEREFLVVSQPFHVKRALYIAQSKGLTAKGFAARDVPTRYALKTHLREWAARAKMFLDLKVLNTEPRFFGPKISIPPSV